MKTWAYRYRDGADREQMIDAVRGLVKAGHRVALGVRHPPGAVLVHGDKDGIFMAQLASPIPPLGSGTSRR